MDSLPCSLWKEPRSTCLQAENTKRITAESLAMRENPEIPFLSDSTGFDYSNLLNHRGWGAIGVVTFSRGCRRAEQQAAPAPLLINTCWVPCN